MDRDRRRIQIGYGVIQSFAESESSRSGPCRGKVAFKGTLIFVPQVFSGSDPPVVRILDFAELEKEKRLQERDRFKKIKQNLKQEKTKEIRLT